MFDTIFLDRDGTINDVGYGYINGLSDFHFYDYAFEALDILKGHAKNFIIVTNQSGLSTGRVSINPLNEIHQFVTEEFEKRGLPLRKIYFADDYNEGFNAIRKPGIGMFLQAKEDFNVDLISDVCHISTKQFFPIRVILGAQNPGTGFFSFILLGVHGYHGVWIIGVLSATLIFTKIVYKQSLELIEFTKGSILGFLIFILFLQMGKIIFHLQEF